METVYFQQKITQAKPILVFFYPVAILENQKFQKQYC